MRISACDKYVRLKTVCDWIAKGYSNQTLHKLIEEKFDLSSYQSRNRLIKEALAEAYDELDLETLRKAHAQKLDNIVEAALTDGQYTAAISAIDKANKLAGLYTERHEHKVEGEVITIKFGE